MREAGPVALGPEVTSFAVTRVTLPAPPRPQWKAVDWCEGTDGCGSVMLKLRLVVMVGSWWLVVLGVGEVMWALVSERGNFREHREA